MLEHLCQCVCVCAVCWDSCPPSNVPRMFSTVEDRLFSLRSERGRELNAFENTISTVLILSQVLHKFSRILHLSSFFGHVFAFPPTVPCWAPQNDSSLCLSVSFSFFYYFGLSPAGVRASSLVKLLSISLTRPLARVKSHSTTSVSHWTPIRRSMDEFRLIQFVCTTFSLLYSLLSFTKSFYVNHNPRLSALSSFLLNEHSSRCFLLAKFKFLSRRKVVQSLAFTGYRIK